MTLVSGIISATIKILRKIQKLPSFQPVYKVVNVKYDFWSKNIFKTKSSSFFLTGSCGAFV